MNHPEIAKIGLGNVDEARLKKSIDILVDANELPRTPAVCRNLHARRSCRRERPAEEAGRREAERSPLHPGAEERARAGMQNHLRKPVNGPSD